MFDVSFSELALIGVVALVVIGPERLPKVARTVGHLIGRAQRYVNDVKGDIQREMDLGDLSNLKGQMEEAARSVQTSLKEGAQSLQAPLQEAKDALANAAHTLHDTATGSAASTETPAPPAAALDSPATAPVTTPLAGAVESPATASVTAPAATSVEAPLVGAIESPAATAAPSTALPSAPEPQKDLPGFAEASALAQPVPSKPSSGTPT
ncbi:Sec-independent protein translocase protein TatB [Paralcaligenes ureilyticus]|uniref:Sec-independent protein translocase protein TatB n=1 Tax=Paralcaligenes ureilyticus TaxID=627131 RepID=A0A4R3LPK6_9BURK|nr:Sec-independent protein translocase protein TatB [Paralcaligenes ureilyticus]TCT02101.1 Sec-independent protein translocase TatB [Paralcaligenes ureilyticus]